MKKYFSVILLVISTLGAQQPIVDNDSISEVAEAKEVNWGAFISLLSEILEETEPSGRSFSSRIETLQQKEIIPANWALTESESLTRGQLSYVLVKVYKLKGSFMNSFFPSGRYSYQLLADKGIMPPRRSENDRLSGDEVLEAIRRLDEAGNQ